MKALFFSLALVCTTTFVQAQDNKAEKAPAATKLEKQYLNLKEKSNTWQGYEVVDVKTLESFWKSVQETIAVKDKKLETFEADADARLQEARQDVAAQEKQLLDMQQEMKQKEAEIQKSMHDITHISVLGIDLPKSTYILLNTGIILALLIALGVMLVQHKSSKRVAVEKRDAYDEVANELAEYKKTVREREMKLKRELQTERNLVEDQKQEIASLKRQPQL